LSNHNWCNKQDTYTFIQIRCASHSIECEVHLQVTRWSSLRLRHPQNRTIQSTTTLARTLCLTTRIRSNPKSLKIPRQ
jgi:hypothetical protein